ncbi:sec-independent protein translocase protein TatAd [bacterium BMS3Abin07]|nr:sec-independent protein translocase protein TatAd [bacterium BMS3Abin07]GBE31787.1 sec-independent protein translocase protein TatAd [bacterium BMS3Bbin05]HDO23387.1 twin-arginine translocase subunit TatB [Nitrospirota bacterium]HDZ87433.1 twin-arginine translocase subunit TatB [Nitrospirota bacterium]
MFDLGMQELIVIFVVALLVIGPKKLPELGRTLGKGIAELKKSMAGIKDQINEEVEDVKEQIPEEVTDLKEEPPIKDKQQDYNGVKSDDITKSEEPPKTGEEKDVDG